MELEGEICSSRDVDTELKTGLYSLESLAGNTARWMLSSDPGRIQLRNQACQVACQFNPDGDMPVRRNHSLVPGFIGSLALGWGVLLSGSPAAADRLVLKSGAEVEGMVVTESEDRVVFRDTNNMVMHLQPSTIERIERGRSASMETTLGDGAAAAGRHEDALMHYRRALSAGGDEAVIQPKIDAARKAVEQKSLGAWADPVGKVRSRLDSGDLAGAAQLLQALDERVGEGLVDVRQVVRELQGELHLRRAEEYANVIEYERSADELRQALRFDPRNPDIHLRIGDMNALSIRTHGEAIENYKRAISVGSGELTREQRLVTMLKIADLSQSQGNHLQAVQYYENVFGEDPDFRRDVTDRFIDSLTEIAESGDVRNRDMAIAALRQAAAARPENIEVQEYLAELLLEKEDWDAAIGAYSRLLEISPEHEGANFSIATAYSGKRDILSAKNHFEDELGIDSRNYEAHCDLGDILWTLGDYELAQEHFESARDVDPTEPRALVALASTDRRLGNYAEARRSIREILDQYPRNIRANLEMGLVFLDEKKYREAPDFLTKVVDLVDEFGIGTTQEGRSFLADAYLARGAISLLTTGPGTATKDFNKALDVYPDYPAAHFSIGNAYQKKFASSKSLDDLLRAEEEMLRARELDPNNPEYAFGLGVLYQNVLAVEDKENERKHIQNAIEQYRQYVQAGGAQVVQVQNWIRELGGQI